MKTTRIILALSPLVLLLPNLGKQLESSSPGGMLTMFFYGELLTFFPWNVLLAFVAYFYASHHRGGEGFWWAIGTMYFPFLAPLVLACMPARWDSTSAMLRQQMAAPAGGASAPVSVPIADRLPLLDRCLAGVPEETRAQQTSRFARITGNAEFSLWVDKSAAERIAGEATTRDFTVWMNPGEAVTHLYGVGKIRPERRDAILDWLQKASAPGRVLTVALREPDGRLGMVEYRTAEAPGAGA